MKRLALVSLPWPAVNRPSAQTGVLQAYLGRHLPELQVDCFHPFLAVARAIGLETYALLARDGWAGEAIAGAVLFPEHSTRAEKLFDRALARRKQTTALSFREITRIFRAAMERWVTDGPFPKNVANAPNWRHYGAAGFTITFSQLLASLFAARLLKEKWPHLVIIFGGTGIGSIPDHAWTDLFPQVDHVIRGEGELPLTALCKKIFYPPTSGAEKRPATEKQIPDLAALPCPEYGDYFQEIDATFGSPPFSPVVPIEFSRGCWWNRCAFCNLNIQWHGYRSKKADQVAREVSVLSQKHRCLDFAFCDNALPPAEAGKFFTLQAQTGLDRHFFAEIRAHEKRTHLARYQRGGLTTVQVGIEALSGSLLQKMGKGVTVADNLAVMKNALACGMVLEGNLITEFPGSTDKEVEETLACLELVLPYHPLSTAAFFLGHKSPVDCTPERFGIKAVTTHPFARFLLPKPFQKASLFLVKGYRGDRGEQRRRWRPVVEKVRQWQNHHAVSRSAGPLIVLRDGDGFCRIRITGANGTKTTHTLSGISRKVYLYCEEKKTVAQVRGKFPEISPEQLLAFLQDLCNKKIFYMDGSECLALAPRLKNI